MDETKQEEVNQEPVKSEDNSGDGNQPKATGLIDGANEAAERMEKATEGLKAENDRQEEIRAKSLLAGQAEAGQVEPKPVRLTDSEYCDALLKGEVDPLKEDGFI